MNGKTAGRIHCLHHFKKQNRLKPVTRWLDRSIPAAHCLLFTSHLKKSEKLVDFYVSPFYINTEKKVCNVESLFKHFFIRSQWPSLQDHPLPIGDNLFESHSLLFSSSQACVVLSTTKQNSAPLFYVGLKTVKKVSHVLFLFVGFGTRTLKVDTWITLFLRCRVW